MFDNNLTLEQMQTYTPQVREIGKYTGSCFYTVNGTSHEVAPWNMPAMLANKILAWLDHTYFYAVGCIGIPGTGKSSFSRCLAHTIHRTRPDFKVRWATSKEFQNQKEFYQSLPKSPHVIIFDDLSGALGQLSEAEISRQFEAMTTVRWIFDEAQGKIPVIIILNFHYTKKMEKSVRSQLSMNCFTSFGQEEITNLPTIAEKGSLAYSTLYHFSKLYTKMFEDHTFSLPVGGKLKPFKTDDPFRCIAAISNTTANLVVYSDKDCCDYCSEKKVKEWIPAKEIYERIKNSYGTFGLQSLRYSLHRRGRIEAIHPKAATATEFIERKIFGRYETDEKELIKIIYAEAHQKIPKRTYHKKKMEDEILSELDKTSVRIPMKQENALLAEIKELSLQEPEESPQDTQEDNKSELE